MTFPIPTPHSRRSRGFYTALLVLACGLTLSWVGTTQAATLELAGPDGAQLTINDQSMTYLPLYSPLKLAAGTYVVKCTKSGYVTYESTVVLQSDDWLRLRIRMTPLSRKTAWSSNIPVAGMGQFYMGKDTKGWVFLLSEAGGLLTALAGELQRGDHRKDYLLFKDRYDASINAADIARYRQLSEKAYQDMEDMESLRDTGLIVAGTAVALSILDAIFLFPSVEAGLGPVPPVTGWRGDDPATESNPLTMVHAGLRLSF